MSLHLEIVTPKGKALSALADEVTAPSIAGEIGVLPGHVPLLTALRTGLVSYKKAGETKLCAVGAGFAEAIDDKVILLTDEFAEKEHIDPVLVHKELAERQAEFEKAQAKGDLEGGGKDDPEMRSLIARMNWLVTELELYGEPPVAIVRLLEESGARTPSDQDPNVYVEDADEEDGANDEGEKEANQ